MPSMFVVVVFSVLSPLNYFAGVVGVVAGVVASVALCMRLGPVHKQVSFLP